MNIKILTAICLIMAVFSCAVFYPICIAEDPEADDLTPSPEPSAGNTESPASTAQPDTRQGAERAAGMINLALAVFFLLVAIVCAVILVKKVKSGK